MQIFCHLQGNYDKGQAVEILTHLYQRAYGEVVTIGIGDSPNDAPMFAKVAFPIIVKRASGAHHPGLVARFPQTRLIEGVGPQGWADAVSEIGS